MEIKPILCSIRRDKELLPGGTVPSSKHLVEVNFADEDVTIEVVAPAITLTFRYREPTLSLNTFYRVNFYLSGELEKFMESKGWKEYGTDYTHRWITASFPTTFKVTYVPNSIEGEVTLPSVEELIPVIKGWKEIVAVVILENTQSTVEVNVDYSFKTTFKLKFGVDGMEWRDEMEGWGNGEWVEYAVNIIRNRLVHEEYIDDWDKEMVDKVVGRKELINVKVVKPPSAVNLPP